MQDQDSIIDEEFIVQKLNLLFSRRGFDSNRLFIRKVRDQQPFFSANILAILNRCDIEDRRLIKNIEESKTTLAEYQNGHLAYHWPLKNGRSRVADSPVLGAINFFALSPDADCTCLLQMATRNKKIIDDIVDDLSFYRADNINFTLPHFQKEIPGAENTFLTWFPPRESSRAKNLETIDITVDSNILWFLGEYDRLDIPGAAETIDFIKKILSTDIILNKTFELSPYYPFPLVILYHIARAIAWGKISSLYDSEDQIFQLAGQIEPKSSLDYLLLASIGYFLKKAELIESNLNSVFDRGIEDKPVYVGPLLFPVAQRFRPVLWLAKYGFTQMKFSSESFQWAILLWLIQGIKKDG